MNGGTRTRHVVLRVTVENPEDFHAELIRDDISDALVAAGWGGYALTVEIEDGK